MELKSEQSSQVIYCVWLERYCWQSNRQDIETFNNSSKRKERKRKTSNFTTTHLLRLNPLCVCKRIASSFLWEFPRVARAGRRRRAPDALQLASSLRRQLHHWFLCKWHWPGAHRYRLHEENVSSCNFSSCVHASRRSHRRVRNVDESISQAHEKKEKGEKNKGEFENYDKIKIFEWSRKIAFNSFLVHQTRQSLIQSIKHIMERIKNKWERNWKMFTLTAVDHMARLLHGIPRSQKNKKHNRKRTLKRRIVSCSKL